jgi:hypothetical protein
VGVLEERQALDERWRRKIEDRLDEHFERLESGDGRMSSLEAGMAENTKLTGEVKKNTDEILAIFGALKGFVTVGGWVGTAVKWLAGVLIALGIIYIVWKTGDLPRKS